MSSFKTFKENKEKDYNNNRQSGRSSVLQRDLACVEFSLYSIPFLFNRQSPILSCNLTITNNTGTKLYLKIRCNNSQRYEVRPHQEILDNGAKWYIEIHLKNPSIRNSVRRVGDPEAELREMVVEDCFEVGWAEITDKEIHSDTAPESKYRRILPVTIHNDGNDNRSDNFEFGPVRRSSMLKLSEQFRASSQLVIPQQYYPIEQFANTGPLNEERQGYYNEKYHKNESEKQLRRTEEEWAGVNEWMKETKSVNDVGKREDKGYKDEKDEDNWGEEQRTLLTMPIMATVAIVSFLIGFITA